ncbi:uncharacterized protein LOC123544846 isoform X2 [Mercenaria mercenaria]|uniref:uncharacterized protein LOC123544846 isoform X2 n=1 Tax=Mercenaria mercenaria TaxID=6596 RepID=UPI001E1E19FE|nr:uncharacterized protein LOC123544846 isoform X2 [Mercenaria mercenaria]
MGLVMFGSSLKKVECFSQLDIRTAVSYSCPITKYCCEGEGGCCIDDASEIRLRWIAGLFLIALLIVVVMYGLRWINEVRKCVCGTTGPRDILIKAARLPLPVSYEGKIVNYIPSIKYQDAEH